MAIASVSVDLEAVERAASVLGTQTLEETVDASLQEVVNVKRRFELVALLGDEERFDFQAATDAWGGDER